MVAAPRGRSASLADLEAAGNMTLAQASGVSPARPAPRGRSAHAHASDVE